MAYLSFLRSLLKDRPYVLLVYMTGILPIAKYSSGSELNMFTEFTMAKSPAFSDSFFGFTQAEVDDLYLRYQNTLQRYACYTHRAAAMVQWLSHGIREQVYNPRSVVQALRFNELSNYWTSSGPYDEIYFYIENNIRAVRDDLYLNGFQVWQFRQKSQNILRLQLT